MTWGDALNASLPATWWDDPDAKERRMNPTVNTGPDIGMSIDIGVTGVQVGPELAATVMTTSGRGFNPHEIGHMLLDKVFFVSKDLPPEALEAAVAYRNQLYAIFVHYLAMAQKSQNTTTWNVLNEAGHHEAAELVRSL